MTSSYELILQDMVQKNYANFFVFDNKGFILSYKQSMVNYNFPLPFNLTIVIKALPQALMQFS